MTIHQAVTNFNDLIQSSITDGGSKSKTAMIRSSRPILNLHDAVKQQFIQNGVNPKFIKPSLGTRSPEIKFAGSLKQKNQDVCIISNAIKPKPETLKEGLLKNVIDPYGKEFTEQTLTINVRSQISSIQKNFDTLFERTVSEAQNLHDRCPNMVLGEVYMISVPEYCDVGFQTKQCNFKKPSPSMVEKYIKSFQAITNRNDTEEKYDYQYEATCLLIVDFSQSPLKVYHSTQELKDAGLLSPQSTVEYEGLEWATFSSKLLSIYEQRFGEGRLR